MDTQKKWTLGILAIAVILVGVALVKGVGSSKKTTVTTVGGTTTDSTNGIGALATDFLKFW